MILVCLQNMKKPTFYQFFKIADSLAVTLISLKNFQLGGQNSYVKDGIKLQAKMIFSKFLIVTLI